jgi:hypothetical protein
MPPAKPSASQMALYKAMKVRDPVPNCEALSALSEDIANDFVWLVDNIQRPPWVGVRAAQCVLMSHAEAKAELIEAWMTDPLKMGVAILALGHLDELPEPLAARLAKAALSGHLADKAGRRLQDSVHPSIQDLILKRPSPEPPPVSE